MKRAPLALDHAHDAVGIITFERLPHFLDLCLDGLAGFRHGERYRRAREFVGRLVSASMVKALGPVLTGLMLAGRVGYHSYEGLLFTEAEGERMVVPNRFQGSVLIGTS